MLQSLEGGYAHHCPPTVTFSGQFLFFSAFYPLDNPNYPQFISFVLNSSTRFPQPEISHVYFIKTSSSTCPKPNTPFFLPSLPPPVHWLRCPPSQQAGDLWVPLALLLLLAANQLQNPIFQASCILIPPCAVKTSTPQVGAHTVFCPEGQPQVRRVLNRKKLHFKTCHLPAWTSVSSHAK